MKVDFAFDLGPAKKMNLIEFLKHVRTSLMTRALELEGGNFTRAAGALGIKRTTFLEMRHSHGFKVNPAGRRKTRPTRQENPIKENL